MIHKVLTVDEDQYKILFFKTIGSSSYLILGSQEIAIIVRAELRRKGEINHLRYKVDRR